MGLVRIVSLTTLVVCLLQFSLFQSGISQVEASPNDEVRDCQIKACSDGIEDFTDDNELFTYNLTCGRSGETLNEVPFIYGVVSEEGACGPDNASVEESWEFSCSLKDGDSELASEIQSKIDSACNDKVQCSNIDDMPFAEYVENQIPALLASELDSISGCDSSQARVILEGKCGPPGFDTLAVLPMFMTAFIGLGLGCSLTLDNFKRVWIAHKLPFIIGIVSQFFFMPLIAFIFAAGVGFPETVGVGLIVMGSCPGGATSNLYTYWAKGDVALSISMSGASTLIAVGMMPFLLWLYVNNYYGADNAVPFDEIFLTLFVAVAPAFLGVFIRNKSEKVSSYLERSASVVGMLFLLAVLVIGIRDNPDLLDFNRYPLTWTVCFFYQPLGTLFGYGTASISGMVKEKWHIDRSDKRAIAMECGVQSYAIGVALVARSFTGCRRNATLMPIYIATLCYIINSAWIVPLFRFYASYDPAEEIERREKEAKEYGLKVNDLNAITPAD